MNRRGPKFKRLHGQTLRTSTFIIMAVVWLGIGIIVYCRLAQQAITRTRAYNIAVIQSLQSDISSLPRVSSILPARTSLNMAYVAQSRTDLSIKISKGTYDAHSVPLWFRPYPGARSASHGASHTKTVRQFAPQFQVDYKNLSELRKFVEYMPVIDLADKLDGSPLTAEHLKRTKDGLISTAHFLDTSSLPQNTEISNAIMNLAAQAPSLTDAAKVTWSAQVLVQQQAVLATLQSHDTQSGDYTAKLNKLLRSYQ